MSEKKRRVPKLRFPGFTDAWEQRKLGDLGSLKNGMNFSKEAMGHGYSFVNLQNIFGNNVVDAKRLGLAEASEKQLLEYSLQKGDVLFVRSSVKIEGVGEAAIVAEDLENTTYSGFIIRFRDEYGFNNDFKKYIFATKKVRDQIMAQATNSANKNINQSVLENLTFEIPSKEEQKQIGEYFSNLDHLITLHQRKLNHLKDKKKSLLQKMFPKKDEDFPELRFPGFTGAWEQRKLGEIYTERKEKGSDLLKILSVSIHNGVSEEELDNEVLGKTVRRSKDKSLYKHVFSGDLVFNMMRAWQGAIGVVKSEGMVSPAYITAIPNKLIYPLFMDYCLRRNEVIAQINDLSYGVTDFRKRLYWDSFVNVLCCIPSVEEQKKIVFFFHQLDNLITLHQRKLDHLQDLKKALLQSMFV